MQKLGWPRTKIDLDACYQDHHDELARFESRSTLTWQRSLCRKLVTLMNRDLISTSLNHEHVLDLEGIKVRVKPNVFNPSLFLSGMFYAHLLTTVLPKKQPRRVLELGTGTGLGAIIAARSAEQVHASDINPEAVACARSNVEANQCLDTVKLGVGSLFEPWSGNKYDLILFNPPYYIGEAQTPLEQALYAGKALETISNFAMLAGQYLNDRASILLLLSSEAVCSRIIGILNRQGFQWRLIAVSDFFIELFYLFEFQPLVKD
ncbi:methyltransferase [bacterium]|nr:methyltransferase [bacterium]